MIPPALDLPLYPLYAALEEELFFQTYGFWPTYEEITDYEEIRILDYCS